MYILLWLVIILAVYVIIKYNALVTLKNNRENAFADIDVQLKLRFDLVQNLVNTVQWYATHEKETLENITKARSLYQDSQTLEWKIEANNMLEWTLKSLFAVSENYPDLKANTSFLTLQTELSDIENKISASRRYFNSATKEYNTEIQSFPWNILSKYFWFKEEKFFEIEEQEKQNTTVQF